MDVVIETSRYLYHEEKTPGWRLHPAERGHVSPAQLGVPCRGRDTVPEMSLPSHRGFCSEMVSAAKSVPSVLDMIRGVRLSAIVNSQVRAARCFSNAGSRLAAQVFNMPAMSPTMTEGGVVAWKVKAGEKFSSGDVLLEVETDKATIDVEAQDDGVLWEIIVDEGATGIPVGKPIAILAEQDDDLSTLERPNLEAEPAKEQPKQSKPEPKQEEPEPKQPNQLQPSAPSGSSDSSEIFTKANRQQKLLPSVELLLHLKGISTDDAYENIPASGPKGRILKGDVLAYLGSISKDSVTKVTQYIKHKEHLDLSNIVLKKFEPKEERKEESKAAAPAADKPTNVVSIQLSSSLAEGVTKSAFQTAFHKAIDAATRSSYAAKFPHYSSSPSPSAIDLDDIFDDLLAAPVTKSRFSVYDVKFSYAKSTSPAVDAFDALLGVTPSAPVAEASNAVDVSFKIKLENTPDAKEFVAKFQDQLFAQVPANKVVVTN